ncbi:MAG: pyruvate dehydrogenase [Chloroflexi bacterium]|nr:pyruvate dehydrogenase [Chloroflexota bacterium]
MIPTEQTAGKESADPDINTSLQRISAISPEDLSALEEIQRRVLWLSTLIIHHANHVRPNSDGTKVGGHQASSASVVSILTALYFHFLVRGDRVSIKPHASPVFHAVQYLLGQLDKAYLTTLREYHGLQSYPSRTKDPDRVDFSTGSVGLGAVAPAFAALAHRYSQLHFGHVTSHRFIALIGDAELDEGNVWEAVLDESLEGVENLLWIVDLNRQSLDRVVPGIRAARLKRLFAEMGWRVVEAKYGRQLQALFAGPGGAALRQRIDDMSNEEYQALIRLPGEQIRQQLIHSTLAGSGKGIDERDSADISTAIQEVPDADLPKTLSNLGGHDLEELLDLLAEIDAGPKRPTVLFAYTVKGWGLPFAGHPLNHSMLLSAEQMEELRQKLGIPAGAEWERFDPASPAGRLSEKAANRLFPHDPLDPAMVDTSLIPDSLSFPIRSSLSTQDAFGRLMVRLADHPELSSRIVTTSPDVSVSTNLAGWINKTGVFSPREKPDFETEAYRTMAWKPGPTGQHIELGISEMNLFMLLGMLGLSADLCGQQLIPIGTVYDPFVCRGLDALIYGLYSGANFIFCGTPSGISLSPEGGAHQSTVTPSLGVELPRLQAYEPCFAREVEWTLLEALRRCCDRKNGLSTYLRLSTRPIDQELLAPALQRLGEIELRRQVLAGGYRLVDWREGTGGADARHMVHIVAVGTMVPEAVEAARHLQSEGVAANVLNLVSPRKLFEAWQALRREQVRNPLGANRHPFEWLVPMEEQGAPIVTVQDGASHALSWLGSAFGTSLIGLGVDDFGQSGARQDLYRHFNIDANSIIEAAYAALDLWPLSK